MDNNAFPPAILVTGIHRSGTTFVGKMLSIRPEIGYIHEPFNQIHGLKIIDQSFLYLKEDMPDEPTYAAAIVDFLCGRGIYKLAPRRRGAPLRAIVRPILRSRENIQYILSTRDPRVKRYLIKDPIACLSSEYLHRKFCMEVVVIIRHPAAFVCSIQRMKWKPKFSNFLNQPSLIDDHLGQILESYDLNALSEVERAALFWKCIYSTLTTFVQRNPRMIMIRHEDLSYNPPERFRDLYQRLGIIYSADCKRKIETHTKSTNPIAPMEGTLHTLRRNSRSNVKRWKAILAEEEIKKIQTITSDLAHTYYPDQDW